MQTVFFIANRRNIEYNSVMKNNFEVRRVKRDDIEFWMSLDRHLSTAEFYKKVRDGQGYMLFTGGKPVGILRYNLFWDNTPFCTLLYIAEEYRGLGGGKTLMNRWENDMSALGYDWLLVSTQSDETAQEFYRKLGYKDCGSLSAPGQAPELFLSKTVSEHDPFRPISHSK